MYAQLIHFAVHLKLTQHCKSSTLQKKFFLTREKNIQPHGRLAASRKMVRGRQAGESHPHGPSSLGSCRSSLPLYKSLFSLVGGSPPTLLLSNFFNFCQYYSFNWQWHTLLVRLKTFPHSHCGFEIALLWMACSYLSSIFLLFFFCWLGKFLSSLDTSPLPVTNVANIFLSFISPVLFS